MAYSNYLAAVSLEEIRRLQDRPRSRVKPVQLVSVSHLIAYEHPQVPLSGFLRQAIDGGEPVHGSYWHPLRAPVFHGPERTESLAGLMRASARRLQRVQPPEPDDWHWNEAEKVIGLFERAAEANLCVISVLEPPYDWVRARRVWTPVELPR